MYDFEPTAIKQWAEADRPREKLIHQGRKQLTDAELLAILIGNGFKGTSALQLAQQLLASREHNLHEVGKLSLKELTAFKGIGSAKAISLIAAFELGRRRNLALANNRPGIRSSKDAYELLEPRLADLRHEEFWILLLNRANKVLRAEQISSGGQAGTVVDVKMVFMAALKGSAAAIILSHNHPSGAIRPSRADIDLSKKIKAAGELLDIRVLDHLIIGEKQYFSFADEGLF